MTTKVVLAPALAAVLFLSACGATKIGRINMDPMHYRNRNVTVEGTVTQSVGAFVAGGYQVQDDTGKIYVISTASGVPPKGARVKVTGVVTPGVTFMGKSVGTTIREQNHKVRF